MTVVATIDRLNSELALERQRSAALKEQLLQEREQFSTYYEELRAVVEHIARNHFGKLNPKQVEIVMRARDFSEVLEQRIVAQE